MENNNNSKENMGAVASSLESPKDPLSLTEVMSESLTKWTKENEGKRGYILLGVCEGKEDDIPELQRAYLGMGGNKKNWVSMIVAALKKNRDFRNAVGMAIHYLSEDLKAQEEKLNEHLKNNHHGNNEK